LLKEIYPNNRKSFIEETLKKDWTCIKRRAQRLGLARDPDLVNKDRAVRKQRKDAWTPDQEKYLIEIFESNTKEYILSKIDRPWKGIHARAKKLGLTRDLKIVKKEMIEGGKKSLETMDGIWSDQENSVLNTCYNCMPREELLNKLKGRTWSAIRAQAFKLKLRRDPDLVKEENAIYTKKAINEKYGVDSYYQTEEFKERSKKTNQEKRGADYPTQDPVVKDKVKNAVYEKYGVDNVFQSELIKEKIKDTNMNKYGVESPLQNKEILKKARDTNKEKYGVENPFQMVDRVKKGMLEKYGEEIPLRVPEIMEKKIRTNISKYGFGTSSKNPEVKVKISEARKKPEAKRKDYETRKKNNTFTVSKEEITFGLYLKNIDPDIKHHHIHPELGHTIDFFSPKYNIWIQYDGTYWHREGSRTYGIDKTQNDLIKNLVRFDSVEVSEHIKDNTVINFIKHTIEDKIKQNVDLIMCHQYAKKLEHYTEDVKGLDFNPNNIKASDISYQLSPLDSNIRFFIKKYEWLGTIGNSPKWCFTAKFRDILVGVLLINEPNAYSKMLGKDTPKYEALIQRGATISWAPINTGSKLIMFACKWMVNNTDKRLFVGYADPAAGERGTIYRACNFYYIGNNFGNTRVYHHSSMPKLFTYQDLNRTASFKRWCKDNHIEPEKEWFKENGFKDIYKIPQEIRTKWTLWKKNLINNSDTIELAPKMKFALILGKNKRELKFLMSLKNFEVKKFPNNRSTSGSVCTPKSISVKNKAKINHGKTSDRKNPEKIKFITENHGKMSREDLSKYLKETPRWVKRQIANLIKVGAITPKK